MRVEISGSGPDIDEPEPAKRGVGRAKEKCPSQSKNKREDLRK